MPKYDASDIPPQKSPDIFEGVTYDSDVAQQKNLEESLPQIFGKTAYTEADMHDDVKFFSATRPSALNPSSHPSPSDSRTNFSPHRPRTVQPIAKPFTMQRTTQFETIQQRRAPLRSNGRPRASQHQQTCSRTMSQACSRHLSGLLLILLAATIASAASPEPISIFPRALFPKALRPGDTILFVAPAKYLDRPRIQLAKQRLERLGFKVVFPKHLFRKHGYLAGTDAERAAEINAAFADPKVDAIFPGTGGYGTTRIVDDLDYDTIRRHPKILIGFSDITGLHIAINQQTGLVTFHSPAPQYGLGNPDGFAPWPAHWFWCALLAREYGQQPGYTILAIPTTQQRRQPWTL